MSDSEVIPGGLPPPPPNSWNPTATATIRPGMPLYASGNGEAAPAQGDTSAHARVIGVALTPAAVGERCFARYAGLVVLTTEEWDAVTGGSGGLIAGDTYFASANVAGAPVTAAPLSPHYVAAYGIALSKTALLVLPVSNPPVGAGG